MKEEYKTQNSGRKREASKACLQDLNPDQTGSEGLDYLASLKAEMYLSFPQMHSLEGAVFTRMDAPWRTGYVRFIHHCIHSTSNSTWHIGAQ